MARPRPAIVETQPEIAAGPDGRPLAAREVVVLINLRKRGSDSTSNVTIRGTSECLARAAAPGPHARPGGMPRPGLSEIMVGEGIAAAVPGRRARTRRSRFANREWTVVGVFDAGNTGFSSEIWGDADQLMQAFRRPAYSSVIFRLRRPGAISRP
ncbi:MAG: hypothetical protein MZV70_50225 [Desulfobacterales bacterium]|nr:hypothetical protein [Desulfobacterales bacterium]